MNFTITITHDYEAVDPNSTEETINLKDIANLPGLAERMADSLIGEIVAEIESEIAEADDRIYVKREELRMLERNYKALYLEEDN